MGVAMQKIEEVKKWHAVKHYDSMEGKFIREIKSNYITHHAIASTSLASTAGGTTGPIACGTTDANHEAYLIAFGYSASTVGAEMFFLAGTTLAMTATVVPSYVQSYTPYCQNAGDMNVPFYKLGPSSSICLYSDVTGTFCGWLTLRHEPIFKRVEPLSTISTD